VGNTGVNNTKNHSSISPMKTNEIEQAFLETNYIVHLQSDVVLQSFVDTKVKYLIQTLIVGKVYN
jgi:hypothetical protein